MTRKANQCYSSCKNRPDFLSSAFQKSWNSCGLLSQHFFDYLCERSCARTRRLVMRGSILDRVIRRRLQDTDVPALIIFLKNNEDVLDVDVGYNNISDAGFKNLIDHGTRYANIQELNIQNNDITKAGLDYLLEVGEGLRIRSLLLNGNKFGVEGSKSLALFLLKNSFISRLDVADVDQTASSLIYFIKILGTDQESHNETLRILDVGRPTPGCMHFLDSQHLSHTIGHMLKHNTSLEELHLQKYGFSCHDIEAMMFNAKCNAALHLLDLGCNNIGDHGVDHLVSWLRKRPALRVLILHHNIVTDHGAQALSFGVPCSRLTSLDISHNRITDDGVIHLLNSIKKSPMLRHLKIFGNKIGHPSAQIVRRMLVSKVLVLERLDVRPYRVDRQWHFARYPANQFEKICRCMTQRPSTLPATMHSTYKYVKYVYSRIEIKSLETKEVLPKVSSQSHLRDCKCCYCYQCRGNYYDESCRDLSHPDKCTCCKCKALETSGSSSLETARVGKSKTDLSENVQRILERVDSKTRRNILRWIKIDESVLEEDLKAVADRDRVENSAEESQSESGERCNCSWIPLSICMLQKYLEGVPMETLLAAQDERSNTSIPQME